MTGNYKIIEGYCKWDNKDFTEKNKINNLSQIISILISMII